MDRWLKSPNPAEKLEKIAKEIAACRRCRLAETRTNPVPGEGSPNAEVMFVGEAPGRNEDLQGRPFVGAAGKLLTQLLESIGLSRSEVYITNVVKCRPPKNRDPREDEIAACTPFLDRQITVIRPKIIVALGRHSAKYLFSRCGLPFSSILKVRGKVYRVKLLGIEVALIPTLHPASALYNPPYRRLLEHDFSVIKKELYGSATLDGFI